MTGQFPPAPPASNRRDTGLTTDEVRGRIAELKAVLEAARERAATRETQR